MPVKKFHLSHQDELRVISAGIRRRFSVELNGSRLGEIESSSSLAAGKSYGLSGGGKLVVRLDRGLFGGVDVTYNGKLLPGSASHGRTDWDRAITVLLFLAAMNVIAGLVATLYSPEVLLTVGVGLNSLVFGLILGLLGFNVYRLRRWALITTIVIWILDTGMSVLELSRRMGAFQIGTLLVKIYFFYVFVRALLSDQEELV